VKMNKGIKMLTFRKSNAHFMEFYIQIYSTPTL